MQRVDVILGHNVEYTGSMPRLPILVLECSKELPGEGGTVRRIEIWLFEGVKFDEDA